MTRANYLEVVGHFGLITQGESECLFPDLRSREKTAFWCKFWRRQAQFNNGALNIWLCQTIDIIHSLAHTGTQNCFDPKYFWCRTAQRFTSAHHTPFPCKKLWFSHAAKSFGQWLPCAAKIAKLLQDFGHWNLWTSKIPKNINDQNSLFFWYIYYISKWLSLLISFFGLYSILFFSDAQEAQPEEKVSKISQDWWKHELDNLTVDLLIYVLWNNLECFFKRLFKDYG